MESVKDLARAADKGKAPAASVDALSLADLRKELRSFGATLSECAAPPQTTPVRPHSARLGTGRACCTRMAWQCCVVWLHPGSVQRR